MAVVPVVLEECVAPGASLAVDRALLGRARAERQPWLHVYAWPGDVLLLGRYHPSLAVAGVCRRLSGGRVVAAGAGFVQVSLALPHRSALGSDDPHALRAEQALNRAVRGILGGLEVLGLDPSYPGRDLLTVRGKPIGWISLAVEEGGVTLIEAGVAVDRDLSLLASLADRLDPSGVVPITLWQAEAVTSVARACGRAVAAPTVALAIVEGYRRRLGWQTELRTVPAVSDGVPEGENALLDGSAPGDGWSQRPAMLGMLLASSRLGTDGRFERVRLGGDVIAPVATVRAIEEALRGEAPAPAALRARIEAVLAEPQHFLLGARAEDVVSVVLATAAAR